MKKIARGLILILLLTVLIIPARGEGVPLSVDPTGRTEGFSAVLYDNRNGLPTADANAIAETGEGSFGSAAMQAWSGMTATPLSAWIPQTASPA